MFGNKIRIFLDEDYVRSSQESQNLGATGYSCTGKDLRQVKLDSRVSSLTRKRTPLGPYRRPMAKALGGSWGGGRFRLGEVPL